MEQERMTVKQKAKQVAKLLRGARPDYFYLKELFRHLRTELKVTVQQKPKKLPYVPSENEISDYYEAVWNAQNVTHMILIKTLLYTGIRVGELVKIRLADVSLNNCQIKIIDGKGHKDRVVPFPKSFREVLASHIKKAESDNFTYLFESMRKTAYSMRGIRKILVKYTRLANIKSLVTPHKLRHFLFTWMKKKGIDDALIQPYSGHESRKSLEIYSKLSITDAQSKYNEVMDKFPV